MTNRERVFAALNGQETDIVPYQVNLTHQVMDRLKEHFGDPDIDKKFGDCLAGAGDGVYDEVSPGIIKDYFGVTWDRRDQGGDFGVVIDHLIPEPDMSLYKFPEPDEAAIRAKCEELQKDTEHFRFFGIGFSTFERAWTLRSMEEILIDFIINPEFAHELLDKILEYNLKIIDIVGEYDIDGFELGDDWGQQKGLIMGLAHWREYIGSRMRIMCERMIKYNMVPMLHSCGDISETFPDLVDMGLRIYNTFQTEIYDIAEMKRLYGKHITFYGGVSTQGILPNGTPEEVKAETRRLMDILGKNGGYICAPTHSIPDDVPTENILAFLEVVQNQK